MAKSKAEVNFMEHLKPLLPAGGDASELEVAAQALAGLSPEDRDLLAAVQESPYRLTTLEQFREFPANTEYFVLEPNIRKVEDVGWRYLAQHLDVLLPPELLDAIDPVPFGNHAMQEEQGCFTSRLQTTTMTITEIAYACGFSNTSYFCELFREYYNTTPGQYRKSMPPTI